MPRKGSIALVVVPILLAAGVAAASNPLLMGPDPGLAVNGTVAAQSTRTPFSSTATTGGSVGVPTGVSVGTPSSTLTTPSGTGMTGTTATAGTPGTTTTTGTGTTTTTGTTGTTTTTGTTGVTGTPGVTGATGTPGTTTTGGTTPTAVTPGTTGATAGATTTTGALAVDQIVSIARTVQPGTPVSAFTVPAGRQLVVTDVIVTNPSPAPVCGAAIAAAGTTTTPPVTNGTTGTPAPAAESGTGELCVPAQTSLFLGLTTGLEFASGQSVQLANTPSTATATPTTNGPLHYHLRGFLVSPTGVAATGA